MLLQDSGMLGQKSLLLGFDNLLLALLLYSLLFLLGELGLALSLVDDELFLPQALDFSLMFLLAHATLLSIHLLQSVVLCELLHQLALEFFFHALLFFGTLSLKSELVLAGSLKLLSNTNTFLSLGSLLGLSSLFSFLNIKLVSKLLLELLLGSSTLFLGG